jgi:hypothetical protein
MDIDYRDGGAMSSFAAERVAQLRSPWPVGRVRGVQVGVVALVTVAALLVLGNGAQLVHQMSEQATGWMVHVPVWPTGEMPDTAWDRTTAEGFASPVQVVDQGSNVHLWLQSTDPLTAALAQCSAWVPAFVGGFAMLALLPVLRAAFARRLLVPSVACSLAEVAAIVLAGWAALGWLPVLAASRAIAREDSGLPSAWFTPHAEVQRWPLVVAGLIAALALVVWRAARLSARAERLAADAEGLV